MLPFVLCVLLVVPFPSHLTSSCSWQLLYWNKVAILHKGVFLDYLTIIEQTAWIAIILLHVKVIDLSESSIKLWCNQMLGWDQWKKVEVSHEIISLIQFNSIELSQCIVLVLFQMCIILQFLSRLRNVWLCVCIVLNRKWKAEESILTKQGLSFCAL